MTATTEPPADSLDPAAVFSAALSLWQACQQSAVSDPQLNLSQAYNGLDQFMRELMRIASQFEAWAGRHIDFDQLLEPWPYFLEDHFGETCLQVLSPVDLAEFDDEVCLRVAIRLQLFVRLDKNLPVPVDARADNPLFAAGSEFREFRIQTIWHAREDGDCRAFTAEDDPYDPEFDPPFFGLYGVGTNGLPEHIANRPTYAEAIKLAQNLAPGVEFQFRPCLSARPQPLPGHNLPA